MRVAVNSHALPVYMKNRIASLLCIFETIILQWWSSIIFDVFVGRSVCLSVFGSTITLGHL